ncbi:MAG: hydroxyacid dehydrogenase [Anaerolineae bacterium]
MRERKILYLPPTSLSADILSPKARETLESLGQVVWNETDRNYTADELKALLPGADAVVTSWGSPVFTPDMVAVADRLRVVGHAAGSVKNLLPKDGFDRGILLLSAAPVIADSVAEYTLWAMLSMQRDLYRFDERLKKERDWRRPGDGWGHDLYYKKVGVVAASMVGRRTIALLKPFHCDVMVYDPYLSDAAAVDLGVRKVSLEEMFATADIVTDHAPITPETEKLIGAKHFQSMKDGALFVNSARAWTLDEEALLAELQTGRIRAAMDVFVTEPLPAGSAFRDLDNVMLTPHMAGASAESRARLVQAIAEDMVRIFSGQPSQMTVSWERLQTMA